MCGRFTQQASWEQYYNALRSFLGPAHQAWKAPAEPVMSRYNLAPAQMAPIIVRDGDGLEGVMARAGQLRYRPATPRLGTLPMVAPRIGHGYL
jgi:putative SOS response-associated peptidase YedK